MLKTLYWISSFKSTLIHACAEKISWGNCPMVRIKFQSSVVTGRVPKNWNNANECALFVKGDIINFRNITLTCILCNVLKHKVASNLVTPGVLYDRKHGFRADRSCEICGWYWWWRTYLEVILIDWTYPSPYLTMLYMKFELACWYTTLKTWMEDGQRWTIVR